MVAVASLANCQRLDASFLHSFVDHCRHLTHLDVYGAALAEREVKSGSKKSKAGTLHSDPTRIKKSTRAGLSKLTAGRPHLEVVKPRKEHEALQVLKFEAGWEALARSPPCSLRRGWRRGHFAGRCGVPLCCAVG